MPTLVHRPGEILQFGEFVLSPSQRSLRRNGESIVLTTKAFDLLLFMVENPGRLLTRDEILKAVWPDAIVEEGNLSQSISLVRKALGESANEQRHILTVFGSGYQFAGRVTERTAAEVVDDFAQRERSLHAADHAHDAGERSGERTGPLLVTNVSSAQPLPETLPDPQPVPQPQRVAAEARPALVMPVPTMPKKRITWPWLALGISVLAIGAGALGWLRWHNVPAGNIRVLVAELDNTTGDPTFDHALNKALQIDLQQSPSLVLFGEGRVRNVLKQMQLEPTTKATGEVAREACQRLNGQAVLEPLIANFGGHYLLTLTARDCGDGHILGDRKQETQDKAGVLMALDKLADGIRQDIGESRGSIYRYSTGLVDGETASLDALKAYSEGTQLMNAGKLTDAVPMFQKAIALDPKFAIAYADLSSAYYNSGDRERDKENITKAYELRAPVNDRYRYYIEYRYNQSVTGDLTKSIQALHQSSVTYPHDGAVSANLCNLENWIGNYSEAVKAADRTMEIDHSDGIYNAVGFEIVARAYKHANQFDRALAVGQEALAKTPSPGMLGILVQIAGIQHNDAEIERLIALSRGTASESHVLQEAGAAALYEGKAARSQDLLRQAHIAAQRDGLSDDMLDLDATQARMLVEVGMKDAALAQLASLPKMDEAMDAVYAMAEVGDGANALAIAQQRLKAEPTDQMLAVEYAPAVRAALAMRNGHPDQAIREMAGDAAYAMRDPTVPYLLGQAYLAEGKPAEAIVQFKRFLDNPGIDDPLTPLYALSYLGTARAQAMLGQKDAAIATYTRFFDFWKNADPELPVLQQARAERAKL
jgi:DNA-binding winged helix-turn-helix (wHTH) protein/tetratricopeptide (TPR) repeat protein